MANRLILADELVHRNNIVKFSKCASFWHYTSLEKLDSILENQTFRLSNSSKLNDLNEFNNQDISKDKIHILCFTNSNTEKIPMWYLYAGINGNGASIGLTSSSMGSFINSITTVKVGGKEKILQRDKDFELFFGWVFYAKKEKNELKIKYRNLFYEFLDNDLIEAENRFKTNNFFIKDYPWEYEKEFRIVLINKTNEIFDSIDLKIPEKCYSKLKLRVAPEVNDEKMLNFISNSKGCSKFLYSNIIKSELGIKMDLCNRNIENFIDYLPKYEHEKICKICEKIVKIKKCKREEK